MAGQDCGGSIDLFQQHHPHQLVRPGSGAERQPQFCFFAQARREPVGTTDQKNDCRSAIGPPFGKLGRKTGALEVLTVESSSTTTASCGMTLASAIDSSSIRLPAIGGATLPDLNDLDVTQTELTAGLRRALAVTLAQLGFRALFQASDGGNDDTHRAPRLSAWPSRVLARAPTTFFPDCRRRELPAGRRERSRRRHRSAPSRPVAFPRHGRADRPLPGCP